MSTTAPEPDDDGFALLDRARVAAGDIESVAELLRVVDRWLEDGATLPLERYFRFPRTPGRLRLYRRNKWIVAAAREIQAASANEGAIKLQDELDRFLTRGPWFAWRDDAAPPDNATPLRLALFYVARFNDGRGLRARQLRNVVGNVWPKTLQTTVRTLPASTEQEQTDDR